MFHDQPAQDRQGVCANQLRSRDQRTPETELAKALEGTALPIRWAMWVALAARVFLSLRSLDRPLQQPRFNKAVKRGAWSPDGFAGVGRALGCPVTSAYRVTAGAQRNSRIKLDTLAPG